MAKHKSPPRHGDASKPHAVYSTSEATTASWTPSDWDNLHPQLRDIAQRVWDSRTVNIDLLKQELEHFWDYEFIIYCFEHGIRIGDPTLTERKPFSVENAKHCLETWHEHFDDVTNEVSGTGYSAGGNTVTGTLTLSTANDRLTLEFASTSWTSATITARGAVYYSSTGTASTSTLIAFNDFGSDVAVTSGTLALAASTVTLQN